jgi:hypothetical protein
MPNRARHGVAAAFRQSGVEIGRPAGNFRGGALCGRNPLQDPMEKSDARDSAGHCNTKNSCTNVAAVNKFVAGRRSGFESV